MSSNVSTLTAEEIDIDLLPLIYQYLRCLEREQSQSDLNRTSVEATQKLTELNNKIALTREQVPKLSGIEHSPSDQLKKLDALRAQLILKKQLILKYKSKATPDTPNSRD